MASSTPRSVGVKALLMRTLAWFLPLAAMISVGTVLYTQGVKHRYITMHSIKESSAVLIGKLSVRNNLEEAMNDFMFINQEFDDHQLCDDPENYQIKDFQHSILNFYLARPNYDQIRWIGKNGMEKMRLNANNGYPAFVPKGKLQNKKGRYYFTDTMALPLGTIYMSPFDLNIEHGKVERPYKPMLRIGTPVLDASGRKCGIIVLNYLGKKIIGDFAQATASVDPRAMLLNQHGYYLRSPQADMEWGFMFGHKDLTLGHRFPASWQRISTTDHGQFMDANGLWTFETIHPGSAIEAIGAAAPKSMHTQWKIVSHLTRKQVFASYHEKRAQAWGKATAMLALLLFLSWRLAKTSLTREQLEREISVQAAEYEDLYDFAPCGYHSIDKDGHIIRINQTELNWLGYTRDELIGQHFTIMHANPDEALIDEKLKALHTHQSIHDMEFEMRRKDGTTFPVSLNASPVYDDQGRFLFSRSMLFDLKYRKILEDRLKMEARRDTLTGLHNRRSFSEMASHELARARRTRGPLAVMLFDIDFFKKINDRYGHDIGDIVLKSCSQSCAGALRGIDILARWGGEEFIVLLPGIDGQQAMEAAERLRRELAATETQGPQGQIIPFTVSIGVTSLLNEADDIDAMVKRADEALYAAKQAGRNCVRQA